MQTLLRKSISFVPWRWRTRIKDLPLIAPFQRWLIRRWMSDQRFLHTINAGPARGLRYPICLPQDKLIWTGTWEVDFSTALAGAVERGDVCYDIGGYRGFFSGVLALAGAKQVYVFEPLPDNRPQILAMIEANPGLPIRLLEFAVGERGGKAEFSVMPEASMGKLATSSFQADLRGESSITVQVRSLDEMVGAGEILPPDVMKVDTEGAETFVLKGARWVLAQHRPRLFIEVHSRALGRECHELLTAARYAVRVLESGRPPDFRSEPEVCHYVAMPS